MIEKNKFDSNIKILIAFFIGIGVMYAIVYFFPTNLATVTTNLEKQVTVTDLGIADAVDKVYDSVVVVSTYQNDRLYSSGTGFVYKKEKDEAYILTNNHVIEDGDKIYVTFTNGTKEEVEIVGKDEYSDIAILSLDSSKIISVGQIGKSESMKIGDTVFAVGAPLDSVYSWTVTRGILSGKDRLVEVSLSTSSSSDYIMNVLQTDAAINSGNSGGPLCNSNGEIVGITSLKLVSSGVEGMGFAIPIETAITYANKLEKGEAITQPYLGVSTLNIEEAYYYRDYRDLIDKSNVETGVLIVEIESNSPASKAGLKSGDIITKMDDTEISNLAYLRYSLYKHEIGDTVKVTYIRDGKTKNVDIKLQSRSE